jgi:hypothetical protein
MRMIGLLVAFVCCTVGAVEISVSDLSRAFGNALDIDRLLVGVVVQQKRSDIYAAKSDRCGIPCVLSVLGKSQTSYYPFSNGVTFKLKGKIGTLIFDSPVRPFTGYIIVTDQSVATSGIVLPFDRVYGIKLLDVESREGDDFVRTLLVKVPVLADVESMIKSAVRRGYAIEQQGGSGIFYMLSNGANELVVNVINERPGFSMLINMRSGKN